MISLCPGEEVQGGKEQDFLKRRKQDSAKSFKRVEAFFFLKCHLIKKHLYVT